MTQDTSQPLADAAGNEDGFDPRGRDAQRSQTAAIAAVARQIRWLAAVAATAWSVLIGYLFWASVQNQEQNLYRNALIQARVAFEKDIAYRHWNASVGGIYAVVSDTLRPNPHLEIPERDLTTTNGLRLTMINPAYMTRLAHETLGMQAGSRGHVTSLDPIRPENAPKPWEAEALAVLATGVPEVSFKTEEDGHPVLRYMQPMPTEASCLKCHAKQGYRVGDIRGGISVTVDLRPYQEAVADFQRTEVGSYALIWLGGMGFIGFGATLGRRYKRLRTQSESVMIFHEERYHALVDSSTTGFVAVDDAARVIGVNNKYLEMSGYSPEEILGMEAWRLDGYEDRAQIERAVNQIVAHGSTCFESLHCRKNGELYNVRVCGSFVPSKRQILFFVEDTTSTKRDEERLKRSLQEKTVLLQEVHHRVKNNLQILMSLFNLQADAAADPCESPALLAMQNRVRSIALVHERLYKSDSLSAVNMRDYLPDLVRQTASTYRAAAPGVDIRVDAADLELCVEQATPLGLVVTELVANAFKHAFAGRQDGSLQVSLTQDGEECVLQVADDGPGLPEDLEQRAGDRLGIQLVRALSDQLHGRLRVLDGPGARLELRFSRRGPGREIPGVQYGLCD